MKTAFIGHRQIFSKDICERLKTAVHNEINNGCMTFTMGTHGQFDRCALFVCKELRKTYKDLTIEVVITSLNEIVRNNEYEMTPYSDVKTVMYDIEDAHFKQQITLSNRQMIDDCDALICYVNTLEYRSGAKTALRYAEKRGLKIINLYRKEDKPFYGMTYEQAHAYWKTLTENLNNK